MKGTLIVMEGADGSGKATQTQRLFFSLKKDGKIARVLSFPNYDSESSSLVKMYLRGDFGKTAAEVSPYAASLFYAADRFASFKQNWQKDYEAGEIFLADRYVASNFVHQGVKLGKDERENFIKWLSDLEYEKLALPKPDLTLFLDMPPKISFSLVKERGREDIHEKDGEYLKKTYEVYRELAKKFDWTQIPCYNGDLPRSVDDIAKDIYATVKDFFTVRNIKSS